MTTAVLQVYNKNTRKRKESALWILLAVAINLTEDDRGS